MITGAYPPDQGGLADYTAVLAGELARQGDGVTVVTGPLSEVPMTPGVRVVTLSDHFAFGGRGFDDLEALLATIPSPHRILVQYVPQPIGPRRSSRFKGLTLAFAWWLRRFGKSHPEWPVWTMLHEAKVLAPPDSDLPRRVLSWATAPMLNWVTSASQRLFVAMQGWVPHVEPYLPAGKKVEYLPIPSNVATLVDSVARTTIRQGLLNGHAGALVGHFGTFSGEVTVLLEPLVRRSLNEHPDRHILLVGEGSQEFAARLPGSETLVTATGRLESGAVSDHLAACDLMIQPFPDGASTRRGSIMAGLALGVPVVSNLGAASESLWREQGALALAPDFASLPGVIDHLLAHPDERQALGERGRRLYEAQFSLAHTVRVLRG